MPDVVSTVPGDMFKGNYERVKYFVRRQDFPTAVLYLLEGWAYQETRTLKRDTVKLMAEAWKRNKLGKGPEYTTDELVEDVLGDTEEWLHEQYKAGKIKKDNDS